MAKLEVSVDVHLFLHSAMTDAEFNTLRATVPQGTRWASRGLGKTRFVVGAVCGANPGPMLGPVLVARVGEVTHAELALIAAAPALLDEVERLRNLLDWHNIPHEAP